MDNRTKVAIISPEYEHYDTVRFGKNHKTIPNFGVLYLAAVAEQAGAKVDIISVTKYDYAIDLSDYAIIAFSIPSTVIYSLVKKIREHSKISKDSLLIAGGFHATVYPVQVFEELKVDLVGIGEGEETFREILSTYPNNDFKKTKGVVYRNDTGKIIVNEKRELIANLDDIPFPARHLMPVGDIIIENKLSNTNLISAHIMCSRGCLYSCNFCAKLDNNIRYRSSENFIEEVMLLKQQHGIEGFNIVDINFFMNKNKMKTICNGIKTLNMKWSALARVDIIDKEILHLIKDAGCIELRFGIESGSQRLLDAMNKKIKVDQIINAITLSNDAGINVKAFMMHGFPGENLKSTQESIDLLESLKEKMREPLVFRFAPLPGSPVYTEHKKFGIILPKSTDDIFIDNNPSKWWGTDDDKKEVDMSHKLLMNYIADNWTKE